jgi:hypothetical protein
VNFAKLPVIDVVCAVDDYFVLQAWENRPTDAVLPFDVVVENKK